MKLSAFDKIWHGIKRAVARPVRAIAAFDGKSSKHRKIVYYASFSLVFAVMTSLIYSCFLIYNKSFLVNPDGWTQYYPSLVYWGTYLRQIIKELLQHGALVIPQWDFHIGYGSDVLSTLQFYAIGDPLNALAVFFKPSQSEFLYVALAIVRLYLSGIAFSLFCFNRKLRRLPVFIATFVYVFCGYSIISSVYLSFFLSPMIYLPLLLLGIDRLFAGRKPFLFIAMVMISAVSNFYFFYMLTLLVFIYAIFRFFRTCKEDRLKNFLKIFVKCALSYLAGICLAAVILLPTILAFLNNGRLGNGYSVSLLFSGWKQYALFVANYISPPTSQSVTITGYASIALICIVLLFLQKLRSEKHVAIGFIALSVFLLIPFFGYAFNGFSYVTNRWIFGYSMLVAYITALLLPEIGSITKRGKVVLICVVAAYGVVALIFFLVRHTVAYAIAFMFLALTVFIVLRITKVFANTPRARRRKAERTGMVVVLLVTLISVGVNAGYSYLPFAGNYLKMFVSSDTVANGGTASPALAASLANDDSFYRVDQVYDFFNNDSMRLGFNGTSEYFSMVDADITTSLKSQGVVNLDARRFYGLNSRAYLESLANVKYIAIAAGQEKYVPYGYVRVGTTTSNDSAYIKVNGLVYDKVGSSKKGVFALYKNVNALPLGYTYDSYITSAQYNSLPVEKRQEAMLQSVVLGSETSSYSQGTPSYTDKTLSYSVKASAGAKVEGDTIKVTKKNAKVTFSFSGMSNSETYLVMQGLYYSGKSTAAGMYIKSACSSRFDQYRTQSNQWYFNQHDYLYNLGYSSSGQKYCTVKFAGVGTYKCSDIRIVCQPMTDFPTQVNKLKASTLQNVVMGTNRISGTISLDKSKILCLTIPYANGWSAKVDGKSVDIVEANGTYMAIPLTAGDHAVELDYATPGLACGAVVTGASVVVLVGIGVVAIVRKRKRRVADI